ncbi:hypothetical protein YC2023_055376 [Brassica napus]
MVTLLHEKLVASCVEPKVFGGTRISGQLNPVNHQLHDVAPKVFTFNFMAEEATGASSCSVVEPVSGGVTADGAQLPEDVDIVKNHAMVSFPALGMSKLNARY